MGAVIGIVSVDNFNRRAIARFARRAELVGLHEGVVGTKVGFVKPSLPIPCFLGGNQLFKKLGMSFVI